MKPIEFKLPADWKAPEGKQAGDKMDCVCEIELKPNGMACLTELDDAPMPGYGDDEKSGKYKPGMEQPPGAPSMYMQSGG